MAGAPRRIVVAEPGLAMRPRYRSATNGSSRERAQESSRCRSVHQLRGDEMGRLGRTKFMKMNRIIPMLPVKSMPASVEFYQKLGFTVERRQDEWGWAMLAVR